MILWLYWLYIYAYCPSFNYLSHHYHELQAQPEQSFYLVILQGFYWLSEKTSIQKMIFTHFICIELKHKQANTLEEDTPSFSVKAVYLLICLQTYEYH